MREDNRPPLTSGDRLDGQLVPAHEFLGLRASEDARGGADGADATCADGAGELQAVELGAAFEQADDVAGVEGVAAAGAVDERDRDRCRARTCRRVGDRDDARLAARDHHPARAQVVEGQGLAHRVGLAQDQLGLVGVGNEDVGVGQDDLERLEIVARARASPRRARSPCRPARARANRSASSRGVEVGQDQEIADVQHARRLLEHGVEIGGDEARVGADAVDEPPVLAPDVDDQRLAGGKLADRS